MIIGHARPNGRVGIIGRVLTGLVLLATASGALFAQRFQYTFGGTNPNGEEGNAVIEAANGDIITAGTANSLTGNPQVYVVRTDANGNVALGWHYLYDVNTARIGGATDIKEYPNGDLIVVGWSGPLGARKAFAMRMDATGLIIRWTKILATPRPNTQANSVVIMQTGAGAGDIVIGGVTGAGPGTLDGMLARLDGNGNVLWERTYALPPLAQRDDAINSVDEARNVSPGDIIAVGESRNTTTGTPGDVWVLRVDGNGNMPPPGVFPYSSALYGGSVDNDLGLSIQELRNGAHPGDLVITGSSTGRPATTAPEMVVMQLSPDPCDPANPRAARWVGDNGPAVDRGASVREITSAAVGTVGDIVVGGTTGHGVWGNLDGCMQKFQEGTLNRVGGYYVYGGLQDDEIRSIAEVTNAPNTPGFAFTGVTTSPDLMPPGNIRNLWLGKNDGGLNNTCHYEFVVVSDAPTGWVPNCLYPTITTVVNNIPFPASRFVVPWTGFQVCYWPTKVIVPETGSEVIAGAAVTNLGAYPTPLARGSSITLGYTLSSPGMATITIADMKGRVVYRNDSERPEGETSELVSTTGWSNGTYIAKVTVNGTSAMTRIVVAR